MNAYTIFESPIGQLTLQTNAAGLSGAWFANQASHPDAPGKLANNHPILQQAIAELKEYFSGRRTSFSVAIAAVGTPFQQRVWDELVRIPFGATRSYQELATAIDNHKASRAVGTANGRNPISIFIPCHRVINKSGTLGGYAGGIERKEWLLRHEAAAPDLHMG